MTLDEIALAAWLEYRRAIKPAEDEYYRARLQFGERVADAAYAAATARARTAYTNALNGAYDAKD